MDTPTGSSDIWVPFHQVHHLPVLSKVCFSFSFSACPPCEFPAFPKISLPLWLLQAGSPHLHQEQAGMCFPLSPSNSGSFFDNSPTSPLSVRPSRRGCPSTDVQGSSTCTWSETTCEPWFLWLSSSFGDTTDKVKTKYRVTHISWNFCCLLFSIWPLDSTNFKVSIGIWISMVSNKITSFCDRGCGVTNYLFLCLILSLSFKWQMILVSPGRVQTWRNGGNFTILWIFWDKINKTLLQTRRPFCLGTKNIHLCECRTVYIRPCYTCPLRGGHPPPPFR